MRKKALVGMLFICAVILFLCVFISSASASTLHVPDDYSRIQAAVNAANAGDVVIVKDGIYTENVDVKKRLTIRSENGADFTTVQSTKPYEYIFEIRASYVNISGFTVLGTTTANYCEGIALFSNYCNISYNTISNSTCGIHIDYSNNNKISGNIVSNNNRGIDIAFSSNNLISNNNVMNNKGGIDIYFSNSNIINNNTILDNHHGLKLEGSKDNIITNNSVENNKGCGIYFHNVGTDNVYLNNFINNTPNAGSYLRSPSVRMNSIDEITYTYIGRIYTSYMGNYWSDYLGSDTNGDGIGDIPYHISTDASDMFPLMKKFEAYFTKTTTQKEKLEIPTGEKKGVPGFEAIFAIAGLVAIAYILRRCRK
jgi:nitrous oxidase accessory protein